MVRYVLLMLFSALSLVASSSVTVAAAANVSYAMEALKKDFESIHPDIHPRIIIGSSGKLTAQIRSGAPYDLFLSADLKYPLALYQEGLAVFKPVIYANGSLALLCSKRCDISKGLQLLKESSVSKVAIANPKTAPYGKAAVEALRNAGLYDELRSKFIYGESISQTLIYTLNAADAGIVAASLLYSPKISRFHEGRDWIKLKSSLYRPIRQGMVLLKNARNKKEAEEFFKYIQSNRAKHILEHYGYEVSDD